MIIKNKHIFSCIIVLFTVLNMCHGQLANKDILNDDLYPKSFVFRFVSEKTQNFSSYEAWEKNLVELDGFIGKLFSEEILDFDMVKSANWFNQFAINHPEKLVMVHFNGRERDPRMDSNTFYSAGHWMYHPGTTLSQSISDTQTTLTVNNASVFELNIGQGNIKNDDIVIVPLDGLGNRLWDQAEQVILVSKNSNQIEVIRGQYGTNSKSFNAGVYLAPHAVGGPWDNNNLVWLYNYAIDGPVDGEGKSCIDVFSDEVSDWFKPTGLLSAVDGIQFDIARRYIDIRNGRQVDQNNDGVADNFSPGLREKYELGVFQFYEDLRFKIGAEKLIIGDGGLIDTQRVASEINGIEAEGFGDVNDTYKEFSKSVNVFNYFTSVPSNYPKLNYVTHKDKESTTEDEFRKRERFVLASTQCLGVAFNSFIRNHYPRFPGTNITILDELYAGNLATPHWLGAPLGDYIDVSDNLPDIWSGNGLSTLMTSTERTSCTLSQNSETLQVSIDENEREATVIFKNVIVPSGGFVFSFNAQAESKLDVFPEETPRLIKMEILGGTSYTNDAKEILGFFSNDKKYKTSYYVRDIGVTRVDIKFSIEGDGNVYFTDFSLKQGVQALAREFEKGVVLSNPSLNSLTFNLAQLFPGKFFKRLTATSGHDNVVNSGQDVGTTVSVPALDGLFLLDKNAILNTNNKIKLGNEIFVYPNPSEGLVKIKCSDFKNQPFVIDIYGTDGKQLFNKRVKNKDIISVDFSNYSQGIYIIKVSNNNFSQFKYFIKK